MLCEEKTEQTGNYYVWSWPSGHVRHNILRIGPVRMRPMV
jgi:hypothetical protein